MTVAAKHHVVKPGESLATIATKYGVVNWQVIYTAPCNAELRKRRPNARLIQAGDRVMIPPDERAVLRERLAQLKQLKIDTTRVFDLLERRLQADIAQLKRDGMLLDIGTGAALSLKGLVDIARSGMQMSKYSALAIGNAVAESRVIAKGHVVGQVTNMAGMGKEAGVFDIGADDSDVVAGLKHVTKSFFDMTSPSYWAGRTRQLIDGQTPEEAFDDAVQTLATQRQNSMIAINNRIRLTEQMLQKALRRR